MLTLAAGQTAGQSPELRGVAAPRAAAGEEPVGGEEGFSLQLALKPRFMSAFSRALLSFSSFHHETKESRSN